MNKERKSIDLNSVAIFNSDITEEDLKNIPKDFCGDIVANGNIICIGNCKIPGSLWLNGNLEAKHLKVEGDLFAKKRTSIITDRGINVSGDLILNEDCRLDTEDINVGGNFEGKGKIDSTDINVYGKFKFSGDKIELNYHKIHVGELDLEAKISRCKGIKSGW